MRKTLGALVAVLALMLAAGAAQAQTIGVTADVPFSFVAMGQTLPAGKYEITESTPQLLVLRSVTDKTKAVELPVLTRLAAPASGNEPRLEFDKVGDKNLLSEVWPGDMDGYLLLATKERHTHQHVKGVKK